MYFFLIENNNFNNQNVNIKILTTATTKFEHQMEPQQNMNIKWSHNNNKTNNIMLILKIPKTPTITCEEAPSPDHLPLQSEASQTLWPLCLEGNLCSHIYETSGTEDLHFK